jgi:hypothetical protein
MSDTAQKRALLNYRSRLTKRGIARFEVLELGADRDFIRVVARRLAEDGPESARIRAAISRAISGDALRRSPLVGAELEFCRPRCPQPIENIKGDIRKPTAADNR